MQPLLDKHKQDNLENNNSNQQFYIFNQPKLFPSPDNNVDSSVVSSSSSSSSVVSSSSASSSVAFALYPKPVLALAVVAVAVFSLHAAVAVFLTLKQSLLKVFYAAVAVILLLKQGESILESISYRSHLRARGPRSECCRSHTGI